MTKLRGHQESNLNIKVFGQQSQEIAELIHTDTNVLSQKVPPMKVHLIDCIDQGIIRSRIGLNSDLLRDLLDPIHDWPHVLRQAAE